MKVRFSSCTTICMASLAIGAADAQTTDQLIDFGAVKELWGSQGGNTVYVGTYAHSARTWYEDPLRGTGVGTGLAPYFQPLEVMSLGPTTMVGVAELTMPAPVTGKDWFVVVSPLSTYAGIGLGSVFTASYFAGDGYVTTGDLSATASTEFGFSVSTNYPLWYQSVGSSYSKFSDAAVNYGHGWYGQMSAATLLLRIPTSFVAKDQVTLRIGTDDGGAVFGLPALLAMNNPSDADFLRASDVFPLSPVPEPSSGLMFAAGALLLLARRASRASTS